MNLNGYKCSFVANITWNANNSFKSQLFIHLDDVLGTISVVES